MTKKEHSILLSFLIGIIILSGCSATPIAYPNIDALNNMSIDEARNSINSTVKDMVDISKIKLTDTEFIRYYENGSSYITMFKDMKDPRLEFDLGYYNVGFGSPPYIFFKQEGPAKKFASALAYLKQHAGQSAKQEKARGAEDCLRQIHNTSIDLILGGATGSDLNLSCPGVTQDQMEATINDLLVEWKSKGLRTLLQKSSRAQLNDLVVKMEKGILKLDLKAKELKDAADEDARQVKAPGAEAPAKQAPGASKLAHLLDQRKTLLMVILGSVKQVAAQKATAGG
jgi:cellobiose-specific phosphotransferase system component IIA